MTLCGVCEFVKNQTIKISKMTSIKNFAMLLNLDVYFQKSFDQLQRVQIAQTVACQQSYFVLKPPYFTFSFTCLTLLLVFTMR